MLKIRLQRIGRKNMPAFRIIVAEHTRGPKTGNIVEKVGTYNPKTKERTLEAERIKYWLSVGAQASSTVHNMLVSAKIITGTKVEKHQEKPPAPAEEVKAEAKAPEVETAPVTEATEVKTEEKVETAEVSA
ncbi:MAG: 30S ribosomal protein S16 [Candidatus Kaiserbacteria bacterium]|nr:30S ribosomal protein S16 [Candidatus Kaiserbacteria bacterium]